MSSVTPEGTASGGTSWVLSRKLWIGLVSAAFIALVTLGGSRLGLSESMIEAAIAAIAGLAAVLMGAHAYTDVRLTASQQAVDADRGRLERSQSLLETMLPDLFKTIGGILPSVGAQPEGSQGPGAEPPDLSTPEEDSDDAA